MYLAGAEIQPGRGPRIIAFHPSLISVALVTHQRQKLVASLLAAPEGAEHRAGSGPGVLLFHAPHHHAKMPRFADHTHTHRVEHFLNGLRYLLREPLLNLQAPRVR